ncbi:hypothetical protein [Pantanalinema sp. GBBB05]
MKITGTLPAEDWLKSPLARQTSSFDRNPPQVSTECNQTSMIS